MEQTPTVLTPAILPAVADTAPFAATLPMPYVIIHSRGEEVLRRILDKPEMTLGRSLDCDLSVRDIQLSRAHCKIEQTADGYEVVDLNSKNGTSVAGEPIARHSLTDGDVLCVGKTLVSFYVGEMPPAPIPEPRQRPADPIESLAGTVWGMTLPQEMPDLPDRFASPRPAPPLPASYQRDRIHDMLTAIASSSWDSIYAESRKPARLEGTKATIERRRSRPKQPAGTCLSLQVDSAAVEKFKRRNPVVRTMKKIGPWIRTTVLRRGAGSTSAKVARETAALDAFKPMRITIETSSKKVAA